MRRACRPNAFRAIHSIRPGRRLGWWLALATALSVTRAGAHEETLPTYVASLRRAENDSPPGGKAAEAKSTCRLTLKLIDAETRKPISGLVRATLPDGPVQPLEGLYNRGTSLQRDHAGRQWYVVLESATASVPQETLTFEAFSGLDTEMAAETVDLTGRSEHELTLALERFHHPADHGWQSGNTHLHLRSFTREEADEYLRTISRADGLELVFVSYLTRAKADRHYISNTYTEEDLERLSGRGVRLGHGEEHRHNFGPGGEGYGHVMFLDIKKLIRPVSIGPGIMGEGTDWPNMRRGIDEARRDGATAIWCHNAWGLEDVPNWVAGRLEANNIFDGGSRGTYADSFYRYLNVGLRVPFSTGTDWFIYDLARVYVKRDGPLTVPGWLDALQHGRSFITNGPFLEFHVEGHEPGDMIELDGPSKLEVTARATGRHDFQTVQLVHNGRVAAATGSRPVDGHFERELTCTLDVSGPGWAALRIRSDKKNELGQPLFGHTSAVYFKLAGKSIFRRDAAEALVADMRQAIETIEKQAEFADEHQREEVLNVYREGIATLEKRLGQSTE